MASTTHFLDLNDDCVLEIFKYLSLQETFTLFGTICERIDNLILAKLYRAKHITIDIRNSRLFTLQQLEVLGRSIESLELISSWLLPPGLPRNYLASICNQRNLQYLALRCIHFNENIQQCLIKVAPQLKTLVLTHCQLNDDLLGSVLANCHNLRTLTIFGNNELTCASLNRLKSSCFNLLQLKVYVLCGCGLEKYRKCNPQMPSSSEDDTDSNTQLLDLNDDCLLEIFKHLSIQEMFSLLGAICQRIDNVIYESLSRVKHLSISLREPPQFTCEQLEILASNLTSIYISAGYSLSATLTLNYLEPICKQTNLQLLALHYVHFNEHFQQCLRKVAANLHLLDLSYCQLTDELLAPVLENCHNLRTLAIFGNYKLKCASLNCLKSSHFKELKVEENALNKIEIQKFKANNPQVTITIFSIGNLDHFRNNYV